MNQKISLLLYLLLLRKQGKKNILHPILTYDLKRIWWLLTSCIQHLTLFRLFYVALIDYNRIYSSYQWFRQIMIGLEQLLIVFWRLITGFSQMLRGFLNPLKGLRHILKVFSQILRGFWEPPTIFFSFCMALGIFERIYIYSKTILTAYRWFWKYMRDLGRFWQDLPGYDKLLAVNERLFKIETWFGFFWQDNLVVFS